jgi:hypothetical protein
MNFFGQRHDFISRTKLRRRGVRRTVSYCSLWEIKSTLVLDPRSEQTRCSRDPTPSLTTTKAITPSGFDQSGPTCEMYHSRVKECFPFHLVTWSWDWTIEDEQCQRVGGWYRAMKFRFLLFL